MWLILKPSSSAGALIPESLHPERRLSLHVHLFSGCRVIVRTKYEQKQLDSEVDGHFSRMQKLGTRVCVLMLVPSMHLHVVAVNPGTVSQLRCPKLS